jgi:DNA-nicking Smr family endonuclease
MKPSQGQSLFQPFEGLMKRLEKRGVSLPASPPVGPAPIEACDPESERALFCQAMAGVTPLRRSKYAEPPAKTILPREAPTCDTQVLRQLTALVEQGDGFIWAHTCEYMEGTGPRVHPSLTRRLHRGDFALQGHIDLHGLTAQQAKTALDAFLKESVTTGRRAVLVVHGRGLSSAGKPVLKTRVAQWLSAGFWRKWVLAFSSARACDGGAGATYVLLRRRPLARNQCRSQDPG